MILTVNCSFTLDKLGQIFIDRQQLPDSTELQPSVVNIFTVRKAQAMGRTESKLRHFE